MEMEWSRVETNIFEMDKKCQDETGFEM